MSSCNYEREKEKARAMKTESKVSSSRLARRKKIVDRGSDRLALITGQIKNLPPPSDDVTSPVSSPPSVSPAPLNLQSQPSPDQSTVSPNGDGGDSSSVPPKQNSGVESTRIDSYNNATRTELSKGTSEATFEGSTSSPHEVLNKIQPSLMSSTFQESTITHADTEQRSEHSQPTSTFTMKKISSVISSLEQTRILCSTIVAFLALLSYLGFPLLASAFMKNTILSKPLYFVLLTNMTIVLAKLLQKKGRPQQGRSGPSRSVISEDGYDWTQQLGHVIEGGLMLYKVIDAVFMDCSIYAAIIICGLAFAQQLGW